MLSTSAGGRKQTGSVPARPTSIWAGGKESPNARSLQTGLFARPYRVETCGQVGRAKAVQQRLLPRRKIPGRDLPRCRHRTHPLDVDSQRLCPAHGNQGHFLSMAQVKLDLRLVPWRREGRFAVCAVCKANLAGWHPDMPCQNCPQPGPTHDKPAAIALETKTGGTRSFVLW
jgi:hypothetical protein